MSGACRSNDDVTGDGTGKGTVSSASMYGKMGNGCSFECTAGGACTAKQAACAEGHFAECGQCRSRFLAGPLIVASALLWFVGLRGSSLGLLQNLLRSFWMSMLCSQRWYRAERQLL